MSRMCVNVLLQSNLPSHDLQARVITFQDTSAAGGDVKLLP